MDDRRRFERVNLPHLAEVFAEEKNKRLGSVRMLARGGLLLETGEPFVEGSHHTLQIVDESEGIRREVKAIVRYTEPMGVGFEFYGLDAEAAVEIGVIIGKYYAGAVADD